MIISITAFSALCTEYCARMWNKTRCGKGPCLWRPCARHWHLQRFHHSLHNILRKDVEQDTMSQASMPLATMTETPVFTAFWPAFRASLYKLLCKDVEQDTLSEESMVLATMRKTLVFTAFWPRCKTYNILHNDVEQDTLSQASMLLATMPKILVLAAFWSLCRM